MRRVLTVAVALVALTACGMNLGRVKGSGAGPAAAKKDCAACEKMCAVAGDAEKNPDGVAQCKADCKKSCQ